MKDKLYFIVVKDTEGKWIYEPDSQGRPTMYRDLKQLKRYMYKFILRNHSYSCPQSNEFAVAVYSLNGEPVLFKNIEEMSED